MTTDDDLIDRLWLEGEIIQAAPCPNLINPIYWRWRWRLRELYRRRPDLKPRKRTT